VVSFGVQTHTAQELRDGIGREGAIGLLAGIALGLTGACRCSEASRFSSNEVRVPIAGQLAHAAQGAERDRSVYPWRRRPRPLMLDVIRLSFAMEAAVELSAV